MQLNTAGEIWKHFEQSFSCFSHSRKFRSFRHKKYSIRSTVAELRTILNNTKSITFENLATAMLVHSLYTQITL
ncbi:hypothetical protein BC833DRAFT_596222 [Globomyces pollinis-pini]|nr:hypothetical protein BC833DRAFT_596222 [Globomyces pollinis-pini]